MNYHKITAGFVIQRFNDLGEFIDQEFIAGDDVSFETADGDPINVADMPKGSEEYEPFTMGKPVSSPIIGVETSGGCVVAVVNGDVNEIEYYVKDFDDFEVSDDESLRIRKEFFDKALELGRITQDFHDWAISPE